MDVRTETRRQRQRRVAAMSQPTARNGSLINDHSLTGLSGWPLDIANPACGNGPTVGTVTRTAHNGSLITVHSPTGLSGWPRDSANPACGNGPSARTVPHLAHRDPEPRQRTSHRKTTSRPLALDQSDLLATRHSPPLLATRHPPSRLTHRPARYPDDDREAHRSRSRSPSPQQSAQHRNVHCVAP